MIHTCAATEALRNVGPEHFNLRDLGTDTKGELLFLAFPMAVAADNVDEAEDLLDLMEDRVLQLKREGCS